MSEFAGKVTLITGAARGAGREMAVAFAALGAQVAANDINPLGLDQTVDLIQKAGGIARAYVFDIAKRMPVEGMVAQVQEYFGRIDYLVNHASVAPDASLMDMDEWDFHRTLDVNLAGLFFTIQQVGKVMRQSGGGAMVNLLSPPMTGQFKKGYAAVQASQAGIAGLTHAAAEELSAYHIRINTVCSRPLSVGQASLSHRDSTAWQDWIKNLPLQVQQILSGSVRLALFLCSDAAQSITGQVLTPRDTAGE